MECKPLFNCGKGGALNANDEVVMDAAIMTTDDAGCVGAVRDIEHPISLGSFYTINNEIILPITVQADNEILI